MYYLYVITIIVITIYVLTYKYSRASTKMENTMNEDRFTSQNAWYHFVLDDIVDAVRLHGYEVVMKDIADRYNETLTHVEHFHE